MAWITTTCPSCKSEAYEDTVSTQFTNDVKFITCPKCDRYSHSKCKTTDMTGKLTECCGDKVDLQTYVDNLKKGNK